ncbi:hypothetical protein L0337_06785 [candidate division KSB1 bacterium]|nr:hypothetical protein [candidate division KSB1 bacterium]
MKKDVLSKLMAFLADLENGKIHCALSHQRDNAIMIAVVVPGERWEVEFCEDGSVEVERFISSGEIYGEGAIDELLAKYSDQDGNGLELPQNVGLAAAAQQGLVEQI